MQTISVQLGERSYSILVGPGARTALADPAGPLAGVRQVVVVADQTVAGLHGASLAAALPVPPVVLTFPAGEGSKSLRMVEQLSERLAEARIERDAVLVAFGGGVAGDLAGFLAATWLRGVRFLQVPTTLLAAVDASVGGKTGVNLAAGKNLVGAFHQPIAVVIDTDFLATLPVRACGAGLAESVKHAAIRQPDFLAWHEAEAGRISARAPETLAELIARNCAIKADVVARDEREADLRAILNHGHTVGHALEHLLEYRLQHGECVALGMLVENEIAVRRGLLTAEVAERIAALLRRLGLPVRLPEPVSPADVLAACAVDKKNRAGAIHFVLLKALGAPVRVADVTPAEVEAALPVIAPT